MSNLLSSTNAQLQDRVRSVLRIVTGFAFGLLGLQLIFGFVGGLNGHGASAPSFSFIWFAGILELAGGALVLFGLFTRKVAFVLSGEMAVAFFRVHLSRGVLQISNGGELSVVYSFLFLYFAVVCGGAWSLDRFLPRIRVARVPSVPEGVIRLSRL